MDYAVIFEFARAVKGVSVDPIISCWSHETGGNPDIGDDAMGAAGWSRHPNDQASHGNIDNGRVELEFRGRLDDGITYIDRCRRLQTIGGVGGHYRRRVNAGLGIGMGWRNAGPCAAVTKV